VTSSPWPSLTRTASKMSTKVSSTKNASNSSATMAAPSPRTRNAPLTQAPAPWKMARKATCGRYVKRKRIKRINVESRTIGIKRARNSGQRNRCDAK
jgi:hypothetical protein